MRRIILALAILVSALTQAQAAEISVPRTGGVSSFGEGGSRMYAQTFVWPGGTPKELTVYVGQVQDDVSLKFRVLVTEVDTTGGGFDLSTVLFDSGTLTIPQRPFVIVPVTVDLNGVALDQNKTYAWVLDACSEFDGVRDSASVGADINRSDPNGEFIRKPPDPQQGPPCDQAANLAVGWFAGPFDPDLAYTLTFVPSRLGRKFAGVYFGSFSQGQIQGQFAVLVRPNGVAVFCVYSDFDQQGFVNENVPIDPDGSFAISESEGEGISMNGIFTMSGVSGQFVTTNGTMVNFSGAKAPTEGFLKEVGGYYTGPLNGQITATDGFTTISGTVTGSNFSIIAADGGGFYFFDALIFIDAGGGQIIQVEGEDGGFITVQSNSQIHDTLLSFLEISGSLNLSQRTAQGTFFQSETSEGVTTTGSGSWSATRRLPLPVLVIVKSMPWLLLLLDD